MEVDDDDFEKSLALAFQTADLMQSRYINDYAWSSKLTQPVNNSGKGNTRYSYTARKIVPLGTTLFSVESVLKQFYFD